MTSVMVLLNNTSNVIDKVTMRQKEQMKVVRVLLVMCVATVLTQLCVLIYSPPTLSCWQDRFYIRSDVNYIIFYSDSSRLPQEEGNVLV